MKTMIKNNKLLYSYIAGWTDGDGCIHIGRKKWNSRWSLKLTDKEPLHFINNTMNLSKNIYKTKLDPRWKNPKTSYELTLRTKQALPFINNIATYLVEKQDKAKQYLTVFSQTFNFSYLKHDREEFFAWLAGFFEAEGYVGVRKTKTSGKLKSGKIKIYSSIEARLQLANTNFSIMDFILKKLKEYEIVNESTKLYDSRKASRKKCPFTSKWVDRKQAYELVLQSGSFLKLQKEIFPHMVIKRKKEKILEGLEILKNRTRKIKGVKEFYDKEAR